MGTASSAKASLEFFCSRLQETDQNLLICCFVVALAVKVHQFCCASHFGEAQQRNGAKVGSAVPLPAFEKTEDGAL
jgi:hypothetical protein